MLRIGKSLGQLWHMHFSDVGYDAAACPKVWQLLSFQARRLKETVLPAALEGWTSQLVLASGPVITRNRESYTHMLQSPNYKPLML